MIALLGERDEPIDAVRDYCEYLAEALARRGITLEFEEVRWKRGWARSLRQLRSQSRAWRGQWVLVQYTSLAWSRRGFPWRFLEVLHILRGNRARCGVVFHEWTPATGHRVRDLVRARFQGIIMRRAFHNAERSVFTTPLEHIAWLPRPAPSAAFIPIGANCPAMQAPRDLSADGSPRRVGVFGITGSGRTSREVADIASAMRILRQRIGPTSLIVMGRGVEVARPALENELAGSGVELQVSGILPQGEIAQRLASCDVMLFVRGEISNQRGSALAGVACGLPVAGYRGPNTCFPITEAGVELAPLNDRAALAEALCRALQSRPCWRELHERSRRAYADFFSWDRIAERYAAVFCE